MVLQYLYSNTPCKSAQYFYGVVMYLDPIYLVSSPEANWLMLEKQNAFILLTFIAANARRYNGHPDGLKIGQCHVGNLKKLNMTQQEYRTAKKILILRKHIKVIETSRTRKQSTDGTTTIDTLVELISSTVWVIHPPEGNG